LAAAMIGFLDLLAVPTGTTAFRTGLVHAGLNLAVTVGYLGGFLWRRTSSLSTSVGWPPLALSAACLAALAVSGWLGGTLTFRYGVRVADEATQASGYGPLSSPIRQLPGGRSNRGH
jgi:uncharacterized membrane protein